MAHASRLVAQGKSFVVDFGLMFCSLFDALGIIFLMLAGLETGLEIDGISVMERILSSTGARGKSCGILNL